MPKFIDKEHVFRMFPFSFFNEISEKQNIYTMCNPAFSVKNTQQTETQKGEQFDELRKLQAQNDSHKTNIQPVEPFGDMLLTEICIPTANLPEYLNSETRHNAPLAVLAVQLYDSTEQPIFTKEVTVASIAQIPEVLLDDPNLLLAVIDLSNNDINAAVFAIPDFIKEKILEDVETSTSTENTI